MDRKDKFFIKLNDVKKAKEYKEFEFGNEILYNLCKDYPNHKNPEVTMAKIWFIGKAYAAAIELGRPNQKKLPTEKFYVNVGRRLSNK